MHVGETTGPDTQRPLLELADGRGDGAVASSGRIMGTYVHGFFAVDAQRHAWTARLGGTAAGADMSYAAEVETALDALARHLERHLDIGAILALAR